MRKPRDYDTELKALDHKAKQLKARKQSQFGELVIATRANDLTLEELAGALLVAAGTSDVARKEAWRKRGAAFFLGSREDISNCTGDKQSGAVQDHSGAQPSSSAEGAA